jgi:WD40 repeat protein
MSLVSMQKGHTERPVTAAYSRSGSLIATAGMDYTIRLWNGRTGESLLALRSGRRVPVVAVAFMPDDRTLLGLDQEGVITAWRTRSSQAEGKDRRASIR